MLKLLILRGLPASGKSTFASKFLDSRDDYIRVNQDSIRTMLFGHPHRGTFRIVIATRNRIIEDALKRGFNIIVDDTNFGHKNIKTFEGIIRSLNLDVDIEIKEFNIPVDTCIERDSKREYPVGEKVIRDMYNRYINKETIFKNNIALRASGQIGIDKNIIFVKHLDAVRKAWELYPDDEDAGVRFILNLISENFECVEEGKLNV